MKQSSRAGARGKSVRNGKTVQNGKSVRNDGSRRHAVAAGAKVGVVMGSRSDYDVLEPAIEILREFSIPHEVRVVSAHRTPDWLFEYAESAEARGLRVLIAGAGGAAHLPGMLAAKTHLPVLGVPIPATLLAGVDALLSIVQMPKGVPVGTLAIGKPGAANAALLAVSILALEDRVLRDRLCAWREARRQQVMAQKLPTQPLPIQKLPSQKLPTGAARR